MMGWMIPPKSGRFATWAVAGVLASGMGSTALAQTPAVPAANKPSVVPPVAIDPAADVSDDPWEERKARAREDVEYLEVFLKAKQAECQEAEIRVKLFTTWKSDQDRVKAKGLISPFQAGLNEVNVAEYHTELGMRRTELKDIEIRLARARRLLKQVERSGTIPETDSMPNDDRIRELEQKVERLRKELERASRVTETSRHVSMELKLPGLR